MASDEDLRQAFNKFDVNGDGIIERRELASVLVDCDSGMGFWDDTSVNKLISAMDGNGDGHIEYKEFLEWVCSADSKTSPSLPKDAFRKFALEESSAQIMAAFRRFDVNGDGIIERSELADILMNSNDEESAWNEASVNALATALDRNGDGRIEYHEFIDWICNSEGKAPAEDAFRKHIQEASPATRAVFESLGHQVSAAVSAMTNADVQALKEWGVVVDGKVTKPPRGVAQACIAVMHLLAGVDSSVQLNFHGRIRDPSLAAAQQMMSNPSAFLAKLKHLTHDIDAGKVAPSNIADAHVVIDAMTESFDIDLLKSESPIAACFYNYVTKIIAYYDAVAPEGHAAAAKPSQAIPQVGLPAATVSSKELAQRIFVAFDAVSTKDMLDLKVMARAQAGEPLVQSCICIMHLLTGHGFNSGIALEPSAKGAQKLISKLIGLRDKLRTLTVLVDAGKLSPSDIDAVCSIVESMGNQLTYDSMKRMSEAAAEISSYVLNMVMYCSRIEAGDAAQGRAVIVDAMMQGLSSVTKQSLATLRFTSHPDADVERIAISLLYLMAGLHLDFISANERGEPADPTWEAAQKMMDEPQSFMSSLKVFVEQLEAGGIQSLNVEGARSSLKKMSKGLSNDEIEQKSEAGAGLHIFVRHAILYHDAHAASL